MGGWVFLQASTKLLQCKSAVQRTVALRTLPEPSGPESLHAVLGDFSVTLLFTAANIEVKQFSQGLVVVHS